jgi:hypothetical protein
LRIAPEHQAIMPLGDPPVRAEPARTFANTVLHARTFASSIGWQPLLAALFASFAGLKSDAELIKQ